MALPLDAIVGARKPVGAVGSKVLLTRHTLQYSQPYTGHKIHDFGKAKVPSNRAQSTCHPPATKRNQFPTKEHLQRKHHDQQKSEATLPSCRARLFLCAAASRTTRGRETEVTAEPSQANHRCGKKSRISKAWSKQKLSCSEPHCGSSPTIPKQ